MTERHDLHVWPPIRRRCVRDVVGAAPVGCAGRMHGRVRQQAASGYQAFAARSAIVSAAAMVVLYRSLAAAAAWSSTTASGSAPCLPGIG